MRESNLPDSGTEQEMLSPYGVDTAFMQTESLLPRSDIGRPVLSCLEVESCYGGLHQKFWTPLSRPKGQLMGQNPEELPKATFKCPC